MFYNTTSMWWSYECRLLQYASGTRVVLWVGRATSPRRTYTHTDEYCVGSLGRAGLSF